jgi:Uma2 family endonuclease
MLQARGFDAHSDTSYTPPPESFATRFPYGWRYVLKPSVPGEENYDQIPLTLEDLRNPQLGDQVPQRHAHSQPIVDLVSSLKTYYAKDPSMGVFTDLIMDWGIPGLLGAAPDIAIVPNLKDKEADRGIFKVVVEGTRPCLVIEVMSPGYSGDDTNKVTLSAQAGIAEYLLIKPDLTHEIPRYELSGYRLESGVYQPLVPNERGQLLSQTLQLWFEVSDQGRQVRVTDVRTGRPLLTQIEEATARLAAEARAEAEAEARAQTEAARQQEQAARLAAEARAEAEPEARAQTEAARQQEQAARLAAEARAEALEKRLQELEELRSC